MAVALYLLYGVWGLIMAIFVLTVAIDILQKYNRGLSLYKYIPSRLRPHQSSKSQHWLVTLKG